MPTDVPAPDDLAELIDSFRAARAGDDPRAESRAYIRLIQWPGFWGPAARRNVVYFHADVRVFKALASIKIGEWPRAQKPERTVR